MCGIAGFIGFGDFQISDTSEIAKQMGNAISHRGPDNQGVWKDDGGQMAMVHQRLSILDLSSTGHQPMFSSSGNLVIAFNGEIYNHLDLRTELQKNDLSEIRFRGWRGHSDTETLIVAIETWGLEETLRKSVGMFAFALWNRKEKSLTLVRDRIGEKPLYYGCQKGIFLFGSELKALKAHPMFEGNIDRNAMTLQLRHNYIAAPHSIYEGIRKLSPGTYLELKSHKNEFLLNELPKPIPYWSLEDVITKGQENPFEGSDIDIINRLDGVLRKSVKQQMISDVPLGAFLSGGIDSSVIVALMQTQSSNPVNTFSIGFNESDFNEAEYAKKVANHLGTNHTELYVTPKHVMDSIHRLPLLYDEPFSDSSQIPTFLLSEMTRKHVTVSLSGDAGDELFGGYSRYSIAQQLWGNINRFPLKLRYWGGGALKALKAEHWNKVLERIQYFFPERWHRANLGDKIHKGAAILDSNSLDELYLRLISNWDVPSSIVIGGHEPRTHLTAEIPHFPALDGIERMMALDTITYLPGDILAKVDRAAMGVSLETRIPFLDHRLLEFAWSLPLSIKIRNDNGKWILRQVLKKYIPNELIERPKMGFGLPIDSWLRGPLRDWGESLLSESRLRNEGFFNPAPIRKKWEEHLSSDRNWQYPLWDVLMFQAWLEQQ